MLCGQWFVVHRYHGIPRRGQTKENNTRPRQTKSPGFKCVLASTPPPVHGKSEDRSRARPKLRTLSEQTLHAAACAKRGGFHANIAPRMRPQYVATLSCAITGALLPWAPPGMVRSEFQAWERQRCQTVWRRTALLRCPPAFGQCSVLCRVRERDKTQPFYTDTRMESWGRGTRRETK